MTEIAFAIAAWVWIAMVVLASVAYRWRRQKPIFARSPDDCLFEENRTSGRELGSIRAIGGASNALKVCVTRDTLHVMPCFPFSLMFLPEIWGLEHKIDARLIQKVEQRSNLFGRTEVITTQDGRSIELRLRNAEDFTRALASARTS